MCNDSAHSPDVGHKPFSVGKQQCLGRLYVLSAAVPMPPYVIHEPPNVRSSDTLVVHDGPMEPHAKHESLVMPSSCAAATSMAPHARHLPITFLHSSLKHQISFLSFRSLLQMNEIKLLKREGCSLKLAKQG